MNETTNRLNRFIPLFLTAIVLLALLPSFYYPNPSFYNWIHSEPVYGYYQLGEGILFLVFFALVWKKNKADPPLRYILMFCGMILFSVIVMFIHERTLAYGNGQSFHLSLYDVSTYETEIFFDILVSFAVLFLWRFAKEDSRYKNVLPILIVLLATISVIYGFIKGPDPSYSYVYYSSFFKSSDDLGKVLFAGGFSLAVLAYDSQSYLRYLWISLAFALLVATGFLGLSITFWCLTGASLVLSFNLYFDRYEHGVSKALKIGSFFYALLVLALVLLIAIPSPIATVLRSYFGDEVVVVISSRFKIWRSYLDTLSSWRVFLGDGLLGFYRSSLLQGSSPFYTPLENGIFEVYNSGGVVYLLFYFLVVVIGLAKLKKEEFFHPIFYGIILSFSGAFLFYTLLTNERLLFSSSYLSLIVSYLFMGYAHHRNPEDGE